jgi:hypothetical protein
MTIEGRSDSRSPEKMQGNPPSLDPSKFGSSCSDLSCFSDANANLEKVVSPLANPKVATSEGSLSARSRRMSGNILPATPRISFRGQRFLTRRVSDKTIDGLSLLGQDKSDVIDQKCYDSEPDQLIKRRINFGDLYARPRPNRCKSTTPCKPSALFAEDDSVETALTGKKLLNGLSYSSCGGSESASDADPTGLPQHDANQLNIMLQASAAKSGCIFSFAPHS